MARDELLGEEWVGETHFDYYPVQEPIHRQNITTDGEDAMEDIGPPPGLELPEDQQLDHWTKDGTTWVRHHVTTRTTLFDPR